MSYLPDERVRWIVIHYSASAIEREYTYEQLERDHLARGFREGGYHAYGPRKGGWTPGRDLSQPGRFEQGAHSKGENDASIGYCYEGGVTRAEPNRGHDTRTPEQIAAMTEWIDAQLERFGGDGVNPALGPVVIGHRDMPGAATQCPGFDAGAWWRSVQAGRALRHPDPAEQPQGLVAALVAVLARIFGGRA
jgi:N-acetylmuramoyl-L-alanine amidase